MDSIFRLIDDFDDLAALLFCAASPAGTLVVFAASLLVVVATAVAGMAGFVAALFGCGLLTALLPLLRG